MRSKRMRRMQALKNGSKLHTLSRANFRALMDSHRESITMHIRGRQARRAAKVEARSAQRSSKARGFML